MTWRLILICVSLLALTACAPSKKSVYIEYKKSDVPLTSHTPVIIEPLEQGSVKFLGQSISINSQSSIGPMLYPAANGGMFIASIITHAVLEQSMDDAEKSRLEEQSNAVLTRYASVISNFSTSALLEDSLELIQLDGQFSLVKANHPFDEKELATNENQWIIRSEPIFYMAQDEQSILLKNRIAVYSNNQQKMPIYQNIAEVISTDDIQSNQDNNYWLDGEPVNLQRVSIELFSESIEMVMADLISKLSGPHDQEKTFKFDQGGKISYERGVLVAKNDERTTIRTLRGWLKSVPSDSIIE
jgi:hypothetical protein